MILEFALKSCNSDFSHALIIPFLSGYSMSNENQMDEVNKARRIFCMLCVLSCIHGLQIFDCLVGSANG